MFDEMALSKMYFAAIAQINPATGACKWYYGLCGYRACIFHGHNGRIVDQILQALVNYFQFGRGRLSVLLPHLKRAN